MNEPMSDLGKQLFESAALTMEAQRISLLLGRQQMAREVMGWAAHHADAIQPHAVTALIALCNKEVQP